MHIFSQGHSIGVMQYMGTVEENEAITMAVQDFGHIIKHAGPFMQYKRFSFGEVADLIAKHCAMGNPRTVWVLKNLRSAHARNTPQKQAA